METCNRNKTGGGVGIFYSARNKLVKIVKNTVKIVQILRNFLQSGPEVLIFLDLLSDHVMKPKSKEATEHVIYSDFEKNISLKHRKIAN